MTYEFCFDLYFLCCSEFTRNTVIGGGVVSTAYFPLSFHGTNVFSFNQGPSLAVVGSRVRLYGSLRFSSNSNTGSLDGGALYLTSLGQLELAEDASLSFINNNGTLVQLFAQYLLILFGRIFFQSWCSHCCSEPSHSCQPVLSFALQSSVLCDSFQ